MKLNSQSPLSPRKAFRIHYRKNNFGLSKSEFLKCLQNLKDGDDSLIMKKLAVQLPHSMVFLRRKFSLSKQQSYDVCMNTMLQFSDKLKQDKIQYGNLRFLYTRMCINQYIDGEKQKIKTTEAIDIFLDLNSTKINNEEFFLKLKATLEQLDQEQKYLIKEIYYSEKSMEEIATELNLSYANLRKKKERILKKIRKIYFQEPNINNVHERV